MPRAGCGSALNDCMTDGLDFIHIWQTLIWPMARLLAGMAFGLFLAVILEYMGWARLLGALLNPFVRLGNLGRASGASFGLAFVSPAAANALLAEAWHRGEIGRRELTLANVCNSLPASLAHLPTLFFLAWPAIGHWALALAGINLGVGCARAFLAIFLGRLVLPKLAEIGCQEQEAGVSPTPRGSCGKGARKFQEALLRGRKIFSKRLKRLAGFTIPLFILIWLAKEHGFFELAKNWLLANLAWATFLEPASAGIVILQVLAESGASLGAAGALLDTGEISGRQAVLALLLGGLLATPLRAIRHQLPSLAGFFNPGMALWLVTVNQGSRALCMALALICLF